MAKYKLSKLETKLIEKILKFHGKLKSVLEVGCGTGEKLIYLKKACGMDVSGIDTFKPYITHLKKLGINAQIADARKLPFENEAIDLVLVANMLHHVPNPEPVLAEALRVAKYGVIVAEPWFDKTILSQALSAELSAWGIKTHQALGFFHREGLTAGEIINLINTDISDLEIYYELPLEELELDNYLERQKEYIEKLSENHYLLWELKQIKEKLKDSYLTECGHTLVLIKK